MFSKLIQAGGVVLVLLVAGVETVDTHLKEILCPDLTPERLGRVIVRTATRLRLLRTSHVVLLLRYEIRVIRQVRNLRYRYVLGDHLRIGLTQVVHQESTPSPFLRRRQVLIMQEPAATCSRSPAIASGCPSDSASWSLHVVHLFLHKVLEANLESLEVFASVSHEVLQFNDVEFYLFDVFLRPSVHFEARRFLLELLDLLLQVLVLTRQVVIRLHDILYLLHELLIGLVLIILIDIL